MKKLIILFLLTLSVNCFSQMITGTVDTTRLNLVTLYNTSEDASITNLATIYQWYECAILCDSVLKVGTNADLTKYIYTKAGSWTYLGKFRAGDTPNMWFRKKNSETTAVTYSLIIWGIK